MIPIIILIVLIWIICCTLWNQKTRKAIFNAFREPQQPINLGFTDPPRHSGQTPAILRRYPTAVLPETAPHDLPPWNDYSNSSHTNDPGQAIASMDSRLSTYEETTETPPNYEEVVRNIP